MVAWRDLLWLAVALALSSAASAAMVTAAVTEPRTLLDLPWLAIVGSVGLAMFGGLVATLFVIHAAGEKGLTVNVPLQVMLDLGRAAVLGLAGHAIVTVSQWPTEAMLIVLPVSGVAGQRVLDPILKGMTAAVAAIADRLAGKAKE